MSKRPGQGLTSDQRQTLIAKVKARGDTRPRPAVPPRPAATTDFSSLPGYRDILFQRSAADTLGLPNPFFRVHEALAGATTVVDGTTLLNFSSYDYLGLNGHPSVAAAAHTAIDRYGISCSASRVVSGERPIHRELEAALAKFYGVDDCVAMVSGYGTNVSVIGHLVGPRDLILHDSLSHNSIVMGAKLSGAERRSFPHNHLSALDDMLTQCRSQFDQALIVVEGLYSMDGDIPDLPKLIDIKRRHRCWLMIDEAHALGVLGPSGRGLAEHFAIDPRQVEIWMGTLSKTLAGCGGYIAGSTDLIDYLKVVAGGFVYSVGMSPPIAAAALAALQILEEEPERVSRLRRNGELFLELARSYQLDTGSSIGSAIIPVMVGDSLRAVVLSQRLLARGINALPIVYPAVPERLARLRFFLTADHTEQQIREATATTAEEIRQLGGSRELLEQASKRLGIG